MRIRTDGDYEWRKAEIEATANWWDCNKTKALIKSAETVRYLSRDIEKVLNRDDLTSKQKIEIAETLSAPSLQFSVEERTKVEK